MSAIINQFVEGKRKMKRINFSDPEARREILSKEGLKSNLFVEASAGSGKTTSLVNRMVALVENGVAVDKICTITFTVAAADEFFSRFQELLSRRTIDNPNDPSVKDLGPTTEESRKKCLEALNNIDLCFNGTMDSFCNMVAHELPNELNLPSDAQVISEEERDAIIKEEYYEVLKNDKHPLYPLAGEFQRAFKNPFSAFSFGIKAIFDYRDFEVVFAKNLLNSSANHMLDNQIDELLNVCSLVKNDGFDNVSQGNKEALSDITSIIKFGTLLYDWKRYPQVILGCVKHISESIKFGNGVEGTMLEQSYLVRKAKSFVFNQDVIDLAKYIGDTINEYLFQLIFAFTLEMRKEIIQRMKDSGHFTFFDFLYYLTNEFKKSCAGDRELINHVFERHSHFLIDESQDTNPMQTEMFFYLTSTVKTDDWTKAEPKEGSLFIVGDPKQSIYGFRDADVNAFNKTKEIFKNKDELIYLTKNYRSNIIVKEWFNKMMNHVLEDGSTPLEHKDIPIKADDKEGLKRELLESNKDISFNGVYYYLTSKAIKEDAERVADLINEIVDNDNYKIIAKRVPDENEPARKIDYKDILVITYRKGVDPYFEAFAKADIPFMADAKIFFNRSESLLALLKLLYLMFEPYKAQRFLDVATDLYGLNTDDIVQMKVDGFNLDISSLLNDEGELVEFTKEEHRTIVERLNELYVRTRGMTISSTLLYLLSNKDYLFIDKTDAKFLEYAYFVMELIKQKENDGSISSFSEADSFIQSILDDKSGVERAMKFTKDVNQVKISNLHKVKGLQAPVVILAGPCVSRKACVKYVDRENKKLYFSELFEKIDQYTINYGKSTLYSSEMKKAEEDLLSERGRLEYVAATRAEGVLIIGKPDEALTSSYMNPWEHLLHDPDLESVPNRESDVKELEEKDIDEVLRNFSSDINNDSNESSYQVKNPSGARIKSTITNVDTVKESDDDYSNKAFIGTLVHRLLECIVTSKNKYNIDELIAQLHEEYPSIEDYSPLLKYIGHQFTNGGFEQIGNAVSQDLFAVLMNADDVMCELPFAYKDDKGINIISGTIDCLYKDKAGWHIIDYKTNVEGDVSTLEDEYRIQLNTYMHALKKFAKGEKVVDAHIYHIDV